MALLDGPRLAPASRRPPRQLVVFLHGYGADGNDLIAIGRQWARTLPDAAFVAPHAPERCSMAGAGYQWFALTMRDPGEYGHGVARAAPLLNAFLDAELARYRLTDSALALVGFSQGTMMALHVAARRERSMAGLVGFSGLLADPEKLKAEAKSKPPILLVHGDVDQMIPPEFTVMAAQALAEAGFPVEWHLRPGLAHGIDPEGLEIAGDFLKRVLKG